MYPSKPKITPHDCKSQLFWSFASFLTKHLNLSCLTWIGSLWISLYCTVNFSSTIGANQSNPLSQTFSISFFFSFLYLFDFFSIKATNTQFQIAKPVPLLKQNTSNLSHLTLLHFSTLMPLKNLNTHSSSMSTIYVKTNTSHMWDPPKIMLWMIHMKYLVLVSRVKANQSQQSINFLDTIIWNQMSQRQCRKRKMGGVRLGL